MKKFRTFVGALICAIVLGLTQGAQAQGGFVWDSAHYGVAPFANDIPIDFSGGQLTSRGVEQVRTFWNGSEGAEAFTALGVPAEYQQIVRRCVSESNQACEVSPHDASMIGRDAWVRYQRSFRSYGTYRAILVCGTIPAGYHNAMCWKARGRVVTRRTVLRRFEAEMAGVLILDPGTMKSFFVGQAARCGNPSYDTGLYILETRTEVVEKERLVPVPGPERIVEVPVPGPERVIERERIIERETFVDRDRLIYVPHSLCSKPGGMRPTPQRWMSTRPGIVPAIAEVAGIASGFLSRGTSIRVGGARAMQSQSQSSSNSNSNSNSNTSNNSNQNGNNVSVGVSNSNGGRK